LTIQDFVGKNNPIGEAIWSKKYQRAGETFDQWLDRVSGGDKDARRLIAERKFLFGGRILSNRNLQDEERVTYSNCYVVSPPEDNLESIYQTCSNLARTYSYGGGCGIDISKLAPAGARVRNQAKSTSGAVSFMDTFSQVTHQIGQHGRRGALMISIDARHPDLPEFISIKNDLTKVTGANISVRVPNDFMQAVINDEDWEMSFTRKETGETITRTMPAKELYRALCENNWNYAEPGMLFWDNIEKYNMLSNDPEFQFAGTNPCAEEPLPAGGSCLLGAMNLAEFVDSTDPDQPKFDWKEFINAVGIATRALNDVLDEGLPLHPLKEQRDSVRDWRQVGLGIMGLADLLIKLGIRYGSEEAIYLCDEIGYAMARAAINESSLLAIHKGKYNKCKNDLLVETPFFYDHCVQGIQSTKLLERVRRTGLRNSQLLTIAPTGSISTMLGVSGGLEPIFAYSYTRTTKSLSNKDEIYAMHPQVVADYMIKHDCTKREDLPDYFVFSEDIPVKERIKMQAVWQEHIDASISSTINLPNSATIEDVEELYMYAWKSNLKGVTVYRAGCAREGILVKDSDKPAEKEVPLARGEIIKCSDQLIGRKRKLQSGCGSLHVQAWFDPNSGNLMEVFLSKGSTGGCANFMTGLSRMVSIAARAGVSVKDIKDQLDSTGVCPSYATRRAISQDTSPGSCCPMAVGNALVEMEQEVKCELGVYTSDQITRTTKPKQEKQTIINVCPECGAEISHENGCIQCKSCGWSKCD
jgi:ribonucleoside-diphosphate reductase alpha chain